MKRAETLAFFTESPQPRIAVPVTDSAPAQGMDVAELRIDRFATPTAEQAIAEAQRYGTIPMLATVRAKAEGGSWQGTEAARLALYRAVIPHVAAVDIELSADTIRPDVIASAHGADKAVIASFHDFAGTPPWGTLEGVVRRAREAGADIVKIAAQVNRTADLQTLARILVTHPHTPMIVIGMGERGRISRLAFPALGSVLTFASAGETTAPGQIPLEEMRSFLTRNFQ